MDTIDSHARRAGRLAVTLLACSLGAAACDDSPTDPGDPVEWAAELTGNVLDGTASVSSTRVSFEAAIEIENAEQDAVFAWYIAGGTCAQPGQRIGAASIYPDLDVASDGTADAEATVPAGLDEDDEYLVRVIDESGTNPVVVACGELEIQE